MLYISHFYPQPLEYTNEGLGYFWGFENSSYRFAGGITRELMKSRYISLLETRSYGTASKSYSTTDPSVTSEWRDNHIKSQLAMDLDMRPRYLPWGISFDSIRNCNPSAVPTGTKGVTRVETIEEFSAAVGETIIPPRIDECVCLK